uniref:Uncharacterized protein n=1 Tax=Globodera rostochiensis TaxID=31243 RepID=A0A914GTM8_GLORO
MEWRCRRRSPQLGPILLTGEGGRHRVPRYKWKQYLKRIGGFLIRTSPAFTSLFSLMRHRRLLPTQLLHCDSIPRHSAFTRKLIGASESVRCP